MSNRRRGRESLIGYHDDAEHNWIFIQSAFVFPSNGAFRRAFMSIVSMPLPGPLVDWTE